jgi:peroxiredoxin
VKNQNVVVVAIDTAEKENPMAAAKGFRDKHKLTYPFWVDTDQRAAEAFGVESLPTNVVIDQQGVVRYYGVGFNGNAIDAMLKQLRGNAGAATPPK